MVCNVAPRATAVAVDSLAEKLKRLNRQSDRAAFVSVLDPLG